MALIVLAGALLASGCARDPLDVPCPRLDEGELVITEIHGPQSGDADDYGEWIEIYNPTGRTLDLSGLAISVIKLDGSSSADMLVRSALQLPPGEYAVFGRQVDSALPPHVDYGYIADIDRKLFDSAALEVSSCGQRIDVVVYRNLPTKGSLILSGDAPLTAEANDDELNWCTDEREDENSADSGIRGTPREENPTCEA